MARLAQFYGTSWCPDCQRLKRYLGEHQMEYPWSDIEADPAAADKAKSLSGTATIPVIALDDGTILTNPTNDELGRALGLRNGSKTYHDLAIIGAGPTGLSAAIYTTREDISTMLYERQVVGGLAGTTETIENYPGFPEGVSGLDLAANMEKQARRFGAEFSTGTEITGIATAGRYKRLQTASGEHFAKTVLIATGSDYRKLGVPGEQDFRGRGVHYCATCDGPLYRGKKLVVIGGGNSALQESLFLTKFADHIDLLVRGDELKGSEILVNKVKECDKISIHFNQTTTAIKGEGGRVRAVETVGGSGKSAEFIAEGIFVFIGLIPNTAWLKGILELDDFGFIVTDKTFETSLAGVFAAGDVRAGATLQIASAVGEGVTAALMIREHLREAG